METGQWRLITSWWTETLGGGAVIAVWREGDTYRARTGVGRTDGARMGDGRTATGDARTGDSRTGGGKTDGVGLVVVVGQMVVEQVVWNRCW